MPVVQIEAGAMVRAKHRAAYKARAVERKLLMRAIPGGRVASLMRAQNQHRPAIRRLDHAAPADWKIGQFDGHFDHLTQFYPLP